MVATLRTDHDEVARDLLERVVAELEDGGVVLDDGVVEGGLVVRQPELLVALALRRASPWRA